MKVLVTGARGALGSSLTTELVERRIPVVLVSRQETFAFTGVEIATGDLSNAAFAREAVRGVTHILHCAGEKRDPGRMMAGNVVATRNLIEAAAAEGVLRFIHVSSVGVVGKSSRLIIDEDTECLPMNFYEETKHEAEEIVRASGLPGAIIRPTNIVDERNLEPWVTMSAWKLMLKARENSHLVYMGDVVAALLFLLESDAAGMETYIISSDDEESGKVGDVVRFLTGRRAAVSAPLHLPYLLRRVRDRNANFGNKLYSPAKLAEAGFTRPYGLREGLRRSLSGYRQRR